ncbi:Protein of unknown function [Mesonia phycicola]|uniref:DUF2931 family protein n=1 Tax=Mesonia phycicola TaxID=579105 RepID=A0A1M6FYQ8_9FLAO|nr:DUF2931 family protein [Mesonia phycicola]SHJ02821.1 Protein of unknown function [Mesonia phycicola]
MKNQLKIMLLICFCSFLQSSCQQKNTTQMNKFEWLPTETAPKDYPVYLYKANFITEDNSYIRIPDKRTVYYGWGEIGSIHILGDDYKAVPKKMNLIWLAYTENKYYKAEVELPHKKIDSLFQLELKDPKTQNIQHFDYISVGIAPGGMFTVWMVATAYQIEIGTYYGTKTEVDFKEMIPTTNLSEKEFINSTLKDEVSDSILKEIKAGNIPFNRWKNYRNKYNWKMALSHKEEFNPGQARITMVNGEQDVQYLDKDIKPLLESWALPSSARIQWQDKNGNLFAAKLLFDEQETTKAFKTLFTENKKEAVLTAHISTFNDTIKTTLSNNENEIELTKTQIKVYSKTY